MRKNKLIYFNNVIYGLSKDYGFRAALYRPTEISDYKTGIKTKTAIKYPIKKAIFLPNDFFRDWKYLSAFIAIRDNQFGGVLNLSERRVLIDKKYLPKGFQVKDSDYLIFNHDRYEFKDIGDMELANFWVLTISELKGKVVNEVHNFRIKQWLVPIQETVIKA